MKTSRTITIDAEVWNELIKRKMNISGEINKLLYKLLEISKAEEVIDNEQKLIKENTQRSNEAWEKWYMEKKAREEKEENFRLEKEKLELEIKYNELRKLYNIALDNNNTDEANKIKEDMKKLYKVKSKEDD